MVGVVGILKVEDGFGFFVLCVLLVKQKSCCGLGEKKSFKYEVGTGAKKKIRQPTRRHSAECVPHRALKNQKELTED